MKTLILFLVLIFALGVYAGAQADSNINFPIYVCFFASGYQIDFDIYDTAADMLVGLREYPKEEVIGCGPVTSFIALQYNGAKMVRQALTADVIYKHDWGLP